MRSGGGDTGVRRSRARLHRLRAVVGAVRPRRASSRQLSRHGTSCGVVFLLSHDLSQVHGKGDLGDEVDGVKGDAIELLNDDDGRPTNGALCGSHDSRSRSAVRWVGSRCEDGRPRCFSSARSMVCVVGFFRCKQAIGRRRLQRVPRSARRTGPRNLCISAVDEEVFVVKRQHGKGAVAGLRKRRQQHGWACPRPHGNAVFFFLSSTRTRSGCSSSCAG